MIFTQTRLAGVYAVEIDPQSDHRGHFARLFCVDEFRAQGLPFAVAQASVSYNAKRGTLRGLHFQYPPAGEIKYVRCVKGAIADVIVDLRPESPTYLDHAMVRLSAENGRGVYIPERCAHGFITLRDDTEVSYLISSGYAPNLQGAIRHDDPQLRIDWPVPVSVISERDQNASALSSIEAELRRRMAQRSLVTA